MAISRGDLLRGVPLPRVLSLLAVLLIVKTVVVVSLDYRNYFPPDFRVDFLHGRESYFFGSYQWAFYAHIISGPISLLLGLLLISERFRRHSPAWHRRLGRLQGLGVLLVVLPSGLWMAAYAQAGALAGLSFAMLAVTTGACVALGWRSGMRRRFVEHRRWMERGFLLLCSAVVLRMLGGLASITGAYADWVDVFSAWGCWLVPLTVYELWQSRKRHKQATNGRHAELDKTAHSGRLISSLPEAVIRA